MREQLLNEVENIVTKGEIAHYEQFLIQPQCFKKLSAAEVSKASVCGKWFKLNLEQEETCKSTLSQY